MYKEIKREVLNDLRQKMAKEGGKKILDGGLGVTVKAKDKKSLIEGLEKAEEIIEKNDEMLDIPEEAMEDESLEMSEEEILAKIEELKAMLPQKD
jgi:hypothetical protein